MTIEEFLDENTYNLTPDEYNAALDDSQTMDEASWVVKYAPLMQEKAVGWNKLDAVKKAKPLPERLREAFGKDGFNPGKTYKDDVYQEDFADVKREDFDKALAKMKEYYDKEVSQRNAEADKENRKREVRNWNWLRDLATSDYEKERYIDNPQAALFGEQAPGLGEAPETRWGSAADLGLGVIGAAADALPGWYGMAGPAVRTARDVGHKVTGSPYQKGWGDIGKNLLADAGFSASTAWLPNYRKERRMVSSGGMMPKAIRETVAIERDAENMYKGASVLHELVNGSPRLEQFGDNVKDRYFRETVEDLPYSPLKAELLPLARQQNIDWGRARAIVNNNAYWGMMGLNPETGKSLAHTLIDEGIGIPQQVANQADAERVVRTGGIGSAQIPMATAEEIPAFVDRLYHAPKLTPFQKKTKPAWVMFDEFLTGDIGGAALQEAKTVTGARAPKKAERVETSEERDEIEAIKEREAPFWEMRFKPRKDNSLLYKAWKEYADEHGWEVED